MAIATIFHGWCRASAGTTAKVVAVQFRELMEVANRRLLPTPEGVLLLQQMLSVNGQGSWIIMGYHGIQRL